MLNRGRSWRAPVLHARSNSSVSPRTLRMAGSCSSAKTRANGRAYHVLCSMHTRAKWIEERREKGEGTSVRQQLVCRAARPTQNKAAVGPATRFDSNTFEPAGCDRTAEHNGNPAAEVRRQCCQHVPCASLGGLDLDTRERNDALAWGCPQPLAHDVTAHADQTTGRHSF